MLEMQQRSHTNSGLILCSDVSLCSDAALPENMLSGLHGLSAARQRAKGTLLFSPGPPPLEKKLLRGINDSTSICPDVYVYGQDGEVKSRETTRFRGRWSWGHISWNISYFSTEIMASVEVCDAVASVVHRSPQTWLLLWTCWLGLISTSNVLIIFYFFFPRSLPHRTLLRMNYLWPLGQTPRSRNKDCCHRWKYFRDPL